MQMMLAFLHCTQVLLVDMHMHTFHFLSKVPASTDYILVKKDKKEDNTLR